jgi:Copper transport outer membrane protein, MctB
VIDFRYHLVSMIAVFLALAVGLIVGVTALSGPAENLLHDELNRVKGINNALARDKQDLSNQVNADQALAQSAAPLLLDHRLTGQNVILVLAPPYDNTVGNGISAALRQAGATVTGEISLTQQFMNTTDQTESALHSTAQGLAQTAGVSLSGQQPNSAVAGQQAAAQVIAASILGKDGTGTAATVNQLVLSQFASENYLTTSGLSASSPVATMAVLVVPAGSAPTSGDGADQVLVAVAAELKTAGQATVMAGGTTGIGSGSAITAENGAGGAGQVSTVDNADTETGQISVVWALAGAAAGKPATAYGIESGLAPGPAPTPSSSVTTTSPATTTGKRGAKKK